MGKIYKNDTPEIQVFTNIDLTNATVHHLKIKKPSGTVITWATEIIPPATEGKLKYVIQKVNGGSELDEVGTWVGYAQVFFTDTQFTGETFTFQVYDFFT